MQVLGASGMLRSCKYLLTSVLLTQASSGVGTVITADQN